MRYISLFFFWIFAFIAYQCSKLLVRLDRMDLIKSRFPKDIEALKQDKAWCEAQFVQAGLIPSTAKVESLQIEALDADLIFRSDTAVLTATYLDGSQTQEVQALVKLSPSNGSLANRAVFNLQQNQVKEVNFYKELSEKIKRHCPKIYGADYDLLTGNSYVFMEYIVEAKSFNEIEGCADSDLLQVVETFAHFHAKYWGLKNHEVKGIFTIPQIIADFLESSCWGSWSSHTQKVFRKNWKYMNVEQTLVHGDSRIGNILFDEHHSPQLIDWQAARISKGAYDLAYFLILSLPIDRRIENEDRLTAAYYNKLKTNINDDYSLESFQDDYKHACIMVLTMLSIPWLSGEGSFEEGSTTLVYFLIGHQFWINRLKSKVQDFDIEWVAKNYQLSNEEAIFVLEEFVNGYQKEMDKLKNSQIGVKTQFEESLKRLKKIA